MTGAAPKPSAAIPLDTVISRLRRGITALPRLWLREAHQWFLHRRLRRLGIRLDATTLVLGDCRISGPDLTIAAGSVVKDSLLDGRGGLDIGKNVFIDHATILTADHDLDDPHFRTVYRPVVIESYVIIFRQAIILPGVRLGRGAVVGAGAVVTKDVPPMTIVCGSPARAVRQRANVHTDADLRRMSGYVVHRWTSKSRRSPD